MASKIRLSRGYDLLVATCMTQRRKSQCFAIFFRTMLSYSKRNFRSIERSSLWTISKFELPKTNIYYSDFMRFICTDFYCYKNWRMKSKTLCSSDPSYCCYIKWKSILWYIWKAAQKERQCILFYIVYDLKTLPTFACKNIIVKGQKVQ